MDVLTVLIDAGGAPALTVPNEQGESFVQSCARFTLIHGERAVTNKHTTRAVGNALDMLEAMVPHVPPTAWTTPWKRVNAWQDMSDSGTAMISGLQSFSESSHQLASDAARGCLQCVRRVYALIAAVAPADDPVVIDILATALEEIDDLRRFRSDGSGCLAACARNQQAAPHMGRAA